MCCFFWFCFCLGVGVVVWIAGGVFCWVVLLCAWWLGLEFVVFGCVGFVVFMVGLGVLCGVVFGFGCFCGGCGVFLFYVCGVECVFV